MASRWFGLLLAAWVLLVGRPAGAQPPPAQPAPAQPVPPSPAAHSATPIEMGLRYVLRSPGTKACPAERFFRDVVKGLLKGRDPFVTTAPKTFILTVRRVARGYAATSELVDGAGRSLGTDDEVVDADCTNLVETMGHIVALAFTPIVRPKAELPAPPAPRAPAPAAPPPPAPPSPQELPPPDPPPPPPPPRTPIALRFGAGATGGLVTVPRTVVWGMAADLGIQVGPVSVSGQARYVPPASVTLSTGEQVSVGLVTGGLVVCGHLKWLAACGVGEAGALQVSGPPLGSNVLAHGELGPRLRLEVPLTVSGFALQITAEYLKTLEPRQVLYVPGSYQLPAVDAGGGVGLVYTLPVRK